MTRKVSATRRLGSVLLVDDYDGARLCVREELENEGYHVVEATNGQEALHLLTGTADARFALMILDLEMPVMDGWQLLELLRRYVGLAKLPVIIVTGHAPRLEQLQHPNIFGCIRAPYEMDDLLGMVEACMTGAQRHVWAQGPAKDGRR